MLFSSTCIVAVGTPSSNASIAIALPDNVVAVSATATASPAGVVVATALSCPVLVINVAVSVGTTLNITVAIDLVAPIASADGFHAMGDILLTTAVAASTVVNGVIPVPLYAYETTAIAAPPTAEVRVSLRYRTQARRS